MKQRQPSPRLLSCIFASVFCCASPAHAIVNGTSTASFTAVGELGSASGVLIADNWVLTVAHVANGLTVGGSSFDSLGGASLIDAVYTFSSAAFPNNDIALVHLSTSLNTATPILNDQVIKNNQAASLGTLTMATAQNQTPNGFATTLASGAVITNTEKNVTSTVNWLITGGQAYLQGGDSGGALFKGAVSDSAGSLLLGIASAALTDDAGNSAGSAFVQVANYKNWINATMASSGQQAIWASSVPEPSTLALYALAGLGILAFRTGHFGRNG